MRTWKEKMNQKESEDDKFRRLWNHYVVNNRPTQAFELFRIVKERKDPHFNLMPELLQVKEYESHLKKLGLIR